MSELVELTINDRRVSVPAGITVWSALSRAGITHARRSIGHQPRGPLCGMGVCFECRVTIDGRPNRRSCQVLCRSGMHVETEM